MAINSSTIVAVFQDYATAEKAVRELGDNGVSRESIRVQSNTRVATAGDSGNQYAEHEGGISGFFHRLFGSDEESTEYSSQYADAVESGRTVVTVDGDGADVDRTVALLNRFGAEDVGMSGSTGGFINGSASGAAPAMSAGSAIPVIEEELQVGKRSVQRGGVRVYSKVIDKPVEEDVSLREEHVRVERRPVDRALNPNELAGLRDQSIEVTEMAEEAVISKRARVVEEVVIGKDSTERTETIRDSVRHTEVNVENIGKTGANAGQTWEQSALTYGSSMAGDSRYKGHSWSDVESDLRSSYERDYPGSTWDQVKHSVRAGWDKVTGR